MNQKTNAPVEFVAMGYCSNDYLCRVPQIPIDHKVEIIEHQIQGGGPAADAMHRRHRLVRLSEQHKGMFRSVQ